MGLGVTNVLGRPTFPINQMMLIKIAVYSGIGYRSTALSEIQSTRVSLVGVSIFVY